MAAKKPNAAQVLADALVTHLEQARTAGCSAYPAPVKDLAAQAGLKVTPAALAKAVALPPFADRAMVAVLDTAAPAALREDFDRLAASPQLLEYALTKACKGQVRICPLDQLAEKAKLAPPLSTAFTAAVRQQIEANTLPPVAGSQVQNGQVVLFLSSRPPPARKPEEVLAENMVKVLGNLRLDASAYPLTAARLAELTDSAAAPAVVDKALAHKLFTAATLPTKAKSRDALIILRGDEELLLKSPQLVRHQLAAAGASEHRAVKLADLGKGLPTALKKRFTDALTRDFEAGALPPDIGWLWYGRYPLVFRQAAKTPAPPTPPTPAPPPPPPPVAQMVDQAIEDAFARLNREKGSHNLVSLFDLRHEVPVSRADFDAALDRLRRAGRYTLSAAEGRHGLTPAERDAALIEDGALLLYVSRRLP